MTTPLVTPRPISITLDGSNYVIWARHMTSYLQSRKLWRVVTSAIPRPVQKEREDQDAFDIREENWLCKNGEIVTILCNTSTTEINQQFGLFVTGKEIWDFLKDRYTTTDMAHQYHLLSGLLSKRQQPGQTISAFLSEVQVIWDQLTLAGPTFKCQEDAIISTTHQKQQHLMIFLMALQDRYEPVRASLLHRSPLPTLEAAIAELISEETRLGVPASSTSLSTDGVLVVPFHKGVRNFTSNKPQFPHNRKSSQCSYCHDNGHQLLDCPNRSCIFLSKETS